MRGGLAKAKGRVGTAPGQGHPAAVAAHFNARVAEERRVLAVGVGNVGHLVQAQFLTLVQVRGAGQPQHEQGCRAGPAQPQLTVQFGFVAAVQQPGLAVLGLFGIGKLGQAVAGGVADHVVVGENPRGGSRP